MQKNRLILLRHGQSIYNKENLFTGWTDVDLSAQGIKEAQKAGEILKDANLFPDICFTSWLKRSIHTANLVLENMQWEHIDCIRSWKLNERHYGAWQQRNKAEVKKEVGEKMFLAIRRGYDTPPPLLDIKDQRAPINDLKYKNISDCKLPLGESLKDTRSRTLNYYYEKIVPHLMMGKTVLVSVHGNSLRALVMAIKNLTPLEIIKVEIPTGKPIVYQFDESLQMIGKNFFE